MAGIVKNVLYAEKYAHQTILCNNYVLTRLGIDRSRCVLKLDNYVLLFAPYQLSFKKAILITALSAQEQVFFQRYKNAIVSVSMEFALPHRQEPLKMFIRGTFVGISAMKNRDNVGLIQIDFKTTPEDLILILGSYLENQEKVALQYEEFGKLDIKINPEVAKAMGYNQYAVINDTNGPHRVQLFSLNSKQLEHLEAASAPLRERGTNVTYQLFFRKYRIQVNAKVDASLRLPSGIVKTRSSIAFSPELIEILDDFTFASRAMMRNSGA